MTSLPAANDALPERDRRTVVVDVTRRAIQEALFDEHHRVLDGHRGAEQALDVGRRRRHDDVDAGHVHEPALEHLRVLAAVVRTRTALRADHQRHAELPAAHVAEFGTVVDEGVDAAGEEVHEHDLDDGSGTDRGGADGEPDHVLLGDRHVADAVGPEPFVEAFGRPVHPAVATDLLPHQEHPRIALERLGLGLADSIDEGDLAHQTVSSNAHAGRGSALRRRRRSPRRRLG